MLSAIQLAREGMNRNEGGPFGAIVVKNGQIIGRGNNQVTSSNDPTAHAEIVAIREACRHLNSFQLDDCVLFTSCEPCPMCLGAIYWARPDHVFYACTREDASQAGFDDSFIYEEIQTDINDRKIPMTQLGREDALRLFEEWRAKEDRMRY
ncbi:MAG: nucleoside deaminase [Saprospiraceae bacterium]|nr:nucleoside deaminase [Saprospiraceae bacterium]